MAGGPRFLCYRCKRRTAERPRVLCPRCRKGAARERLKRLEAEGKRARFNPTPEGIARYERAMRLNVFGWPDRSI